MNIYGILIAGGQGKRLWPLSRLLRPKPVLAVQNNQSLIQQTLMRLKTVVDPGNIFIVTNEEVFAPVYESVQEVPLGNFLAEPLGRNTAAAIGLACIHIMERDNDALAIVSPADHYIGDNEQFSALLHKAADVCRKTDTVVVFGVKPTSASTNYGYIAKGDPLDETGAFKVARFTEKPQQQAAEQFVAEGYLWNAGIFVFRISTMLQAFRQHMPELASALENIRKSFKGPYERKTMKEEYAALQDISIDKGVIEKLDTVSVLEMNVPWADLGSFEQIANVMTQKDENGNQRMGSGIDVDSTDTIIVGDDNFVVTANVHGLIVVVSDGRILVAAKGSDEKIARAVTLMQEHGFKEHI